jgi:multicomponent Na+:H+ antiporter subunit D
MNALITLPVVLPLVGAALSIALGRWRVAQRAIGLATLVAVSGISVALLVRVDDQGVTAVQAGGWPAPMGITLVADRLAAILLTVSSLMLLAVLVYAIGQRGAERTHVGFHPVYLVLAAGVAASFLTGDLFNLFVSFEVMLTASYVLITLGGRPEQVRSGMTYVVISLLASTLFLAALAFVYAATGTVNLADLGDKIADLPDGVRNALALLLVVVFGVKAAVFPLFFWLPDSYPTAPAPVTAVFAGLLTKVGVYALIRTQTLLFPEDTRPTTLLLAVAGITMAVGVLGAIAQDDVKRILSFQVVSQMGYAVMGLGLFTLAGLAGAVVYLVHTIVVKTTLFLTAGLVEETGGTGRLARIGGLVHRVPVVAGLFLISALSLVGVPPFSGFVAKLALVDAGLAEDQYAVVAVALVVSLFALFSMMRIWNGAFWGEPRIDAPDGAGSGSGAGVAAVESRRLGGPPLMVLSTMALAALSIAVAVAAGPLYDLSLRAAEDLLDTSAYTGAVLGR